MTRAGPPRRRPMATPPQQRAAVRRRLRAVRHGLRLTAVADAADVAQRPREVRLLPNAELESAVAQVPVITGRPTHAVVEAAVAERGWAIFRETGVDSAASFGELRAALFGEMEMQSYKTGVVRA